MELSLKIIKRLLLAFVFISIGFALGKHFSAWKVTANPAGKAVSAVVRVYYMHGTIRCASCNRIEKMTEKLLKDKYAEEMAAGSIEFADINFQEHEVLAKRFEVTGSCVVVAKMQSGKIIFYKRLDKVWELFRKPAEFDAYISDAIQTCLKSQERRK
ncbi:MAG: nitrophenyl compound nitroreductase subunit ArsF family protein [Victivallaceae bacterium]|nr:nitrophenyl compound nitroreductase subunit ArsF family protein [Victivallaceae bacterium]